MLFEDVTTALTFKVRKWYDAMTHTYTVSVNGENIMECVDEDTMAQTTDEEILFWYLYNSEHNPMNRKHKKGEQ